MRWLIASTSGPWESFVGRPVIRLTPKETGRSSSLVISSSSRVASTWNPLDSVISSRGQNLGSFRETDVTDRAGSRDLAQSPLISLIDV